MRREERLLVPEPKSPLSMRAVRMPRIAASRAIPAPALPAAELGGRVTAVDADSGRLRAARKVAQHRRLSVDWVEADLEHYPIPRLAFDVVLIFNYLDRRRMRDFAEAVTLGGHFIMETFLESQRQLGWGPKSGDHLLRPSELPTLLSPLEVVIAREALDFFDSRPMSVASALAQRIRE